MVLEKTIQQSRSQHAFLPGPPESIEKTEVRFLVADSWHSTRELIANALSQGFPSCQIYQAHDGQQALLNTQTLSPHVSFVESTLPGVNGLKVAADIWTKDPTARIIFVLSTFSESEYGKIIKMVPGSACCGIILKSISSKDLLWGTEALLLYNNNYIDPELRNRRRTIGVSESKLTDIQLQTLQDVAIGLTDRAIGERRHLTPRGIAGRVSTLYEVLCRPEEEMLNRRFEYEVLNPRNRVITRALLSGLLTVDALAHCEMEYQDWLADDQ